MKNLALIVISTILISVSGCGALKNAMKPVDLTKVQIGMSKADVARAMEKKPDNIVSAKQYEDGVLETVQYSGPAGLNSNSEDGMETYWLYFFNDHLVEWGEPPLDWEKFVYQVYKKRYNWRKQ